MKIIVYWWTWFVERLYWNWLTFCIVVSNLCKTSRKENTFFNAYKWV